MYVRSGITMILAAALMLIGACAETPTEERMEREVGEAVGATGAYLDERAKALAEDLEPQLEALEREMGQLQERLETASGEAARELREELRETEREADRLRQDMRTWDEDAERNWENFSAKTRETVRDLQDRLERAGKELTEERER